VLIAPRNGLAHRQTGGLVQITQQRHPVAVQHRLNGRSSNPQVIGDPMRTPPTGEAQSEDSRFGAPTDPGGAAVRAAGTISHRGRAVGAVAVGPLLGRGRRTLEPFSGTSIGPSVIDDRRRESGSALWSQTGISVDHEDLSVFVCVW
jgi:hypothetical protein